MKLRNEPKSELNKGTEMFNGNSEPDILKVECSEESISAFLSDGRLINIPKAWYKPFREATIQQLSSYEILPQKKTVYFSEVDEYLPVRVFTHGLGSSCC